MSAIVRLLIGLVLVGYLMLVVILAGRAWAGRPRWLRVRRLDDRWPTNGGADR